MKRLLTVFFTAAVAAAMLFVSACGAAPVREGESLGIEDLVQTYAIDPSRTDYVSDEAGLRQ